MLWQQYLHHRDRANKKTNLNSREREGRKQRWLLASGFDVHPYVIWSVAPAVAGGTLVCVRACAVSGPLHSHSSAGKSQESLCGKKRITFGLFFNSSSVRPWLVCAGGRGPSLNGSGHTHKNK